MKRRSQLMAINQQEYPECYAALHFPPNHELEAARQQRERLLAELSELVETGCHGTKLDMRNLSPGCRICAEGGWSCLFISGQCNCDCFYCPTAQDEIGLPTTNTVAFRHPADYVAYLDRFGFCGASISGGEPLLTPKRTLGFISAIKRRFGVGMHVWLYTNGTLVTEELLLQLRDAGLDEIRFDIGATDYNLKALKRVAGIIPTLTVEIPAIPEELARLKALLPQLRDAGMQHLNLHQLRLTPHNVQRLRERPYRYLHGEKVTVLDSELAALEVMRCSLAQGINLPVNYCSFVYKNRFQGRAARQRNAAFLCKGYESLTENGFIRSLKLYGENWRLALQVQRFAEHSTDTGLWDLSRSGEQLCFHPVLWPLVEFDSVHLAVGYSAARQLSAVSYRNPFVTVEMSPRKKLIIERGRAAADFELNEQQAELFGATFLICRKSPEELPGEDLWEEITGLERLRSGLQEYF